MRRLLLASALLLGGSLPGCLAAPTSEAWLDVGFRTPRQTFATFQTALRADLPDLEYRCLAQDLKAREGLNQLVYRSFREELFGENPWLRHAACAEVESEVRREDGHSVLVARVRHLFWERAFQVELVPEEFYEAYSEGELLDDGFADLSRSASLGAGGELLVRVPLPPGTQLSDVSEARIGREWKITGFAEVEDPPEPRAP